ncbi:hypothetical protein PHYPSEUDO_002776 [Phytophthora pseudosyringae]|uniref:Uncharacterized protein n=1 Tax=Phytophthora pseudosyringae TaxID=221518 RepID=A0A8T1VT20_9STRA|nr:hypothetical protein PHYPSEUDO_002776 [Phytophthora pseudosyringae]
MFVAMFVAMFSTNRWLGVGAVEEELSDVDVLLQISTGCDEVLRKKRMTEHDKYKCAQSVLNRITAELTDLPDRKFQAALDDLDTWFGRLRQGDVTLERRADSDGEVPATQIAFPSGGEDKEEKDDHVHSGSAHKESDQPAPNSKKQKKKATKKGTKWSCSRSIPEDGWGDLAKTERRKIHSVSWSGKRTTLVASCEMQREVMM